MKIFERDNFTCQYCENEFSEEYLPLHVHHRIFVSQGGKDDEDNKATACWKCHHDHGELKDKPIKSENGSMDKINELKKRYI